MIIGKRVRLRGIEREDLPRFVAWLNDPDVYQNLLLHAALSMVEEEAWFEQMKQHPAEEHPLVIEVDSPQGWIPIGNTGFNAIDWRERSAEIGIFIGEKRFWGQGYGREAMQLMISHGFTNLNLNRIFLRVFETNQRAIHCYENAGFVHEGRLRQARFHGDHYIDVILMSVVRSDWQWSGETKGA
jgi:diamine N-acetyltransferase